MIEWNMKCKILSLTPTQTIMYIFNLRFASILCFNAFTPASYSISQARLTSPIGVVLW